MSHTFYAVLYDTIAAHTPFRYVPEGCGDIDYYLPQQPHITRPKIIPVYCDNPKYTKTGALAKSNRYKRLEHFNNHIGSANGEFFATEEEAQARCVTLKAEYEAQEAAVKATRETSERLILEALAPVLNLTKRLPPLHNRNYLEGGCFYVGMAVREIKLLTLAFPEEQTYWNHRKIHTFPGEVREFDPQAYVEHMRPRIEELTKSLERFVTFMETHADNINTMFGSLVDSSQGACWLTYA